jgi:hypothetical protein
MIHRAAAVEDRTSRSWLLVASIPTGLHPLNERERILGRHDSEVVKGGRDLVGLPVPVTCQLVPAAGFRNLNPGPSVLQTNRDHSPTSRNAR